jgi:hypothetical protein
VTPSTSPLSARSAISLTSAVSMKNFMPALVSSCAAIRIGRDGSERKRAQCE